MMFRSLAAAVFSVHPGLHPVLHHLPPRWEDVYAVHLQGESTTHTHTHTDRRWHTNLPRHIWGQIRFLSAERVHLTRVLVAATVWSDVWVFRQTTLFYSPRCYGYKCKWRGERKAFLFFKEKLSGDSCEWMSAFINATRLFGLISRTIYAVGISRQLKSVHHCVFSAKQKTEAAATSPPPSSCSWDQICT